MGSHIFRAQLQARCCSAVTLSLLLGLLAGCTGSPEQGASHSSQPEVTLKTSAGPMPLRRLNSFEYDNTVQDLLYVSMQPSTQFQFASDLRDDFSYPLASGGVSTLEVRKYQNAAQALAEAADLNRLKPCSSATLGCASEFITSFGERAFRRPLTTQESTNLLNFYRQISESTGDLDTSLRLIIEVILQSPAFLYRWELGPSAAKSTNGLIPLNDYEIASRLSYFIWRSMPDQILLTAAKEGKLNSKTQIEAQARRLLSHEKAKDSVSRFFEYWLTYNDLIAIEKDVTTYPNFDAQLKTAMLEESRAFVESIIFDGDKRFQSLLSSTNSFVNSDLSVIYNIGAIFSGQLQPVSLSNNERGGLLTLAAFLADKGAADGSNPALRGAVILEQVLCEHMPPPPNVIPAIAPPSAGGSTRERFEEHTGNPCASACHALFDPLGFAFESYDGIVQFREFDNGSIVDASSHYEIDGINHSFDGAVELSAILAQSPQAQSCFARQWMRYGLDRNEHLDADEPSIQEVTGAFLASGDIQELIVSITTSQSFMYREPSTGEELQP